VKCSTIKQLSQSNMLINAYFSPKGRDVHAMLAIINKQG